ncbi:NAD(P)H-dependent oxidoreductase [Serratia entomophila]|uniref:NAD(P)H-dependent oxidoreductase n=1 Tax=Serratia entomophila TaxID=42906 RepID=UPI0021796183|nr:NAD(P)H-dependent oxidoreductase [Serratia entomophila]CAI0704653.1 General stress protein 14 [Serratia entomophila]CAI1517406.1 General stress protein 14 [Serratia entomophila]CAI1768744.1 General stress protein 14 [Serratia entomophila]CAI1846939.1 General stress protein 14 [Serratia entomophila]CAI1887495.1 General stress protein 14 [Serratia entomophila]
MSRILVLTAHRKPDESRINQALIEALRPLPNVTVHELIRTYPDYRIDVAREQELLEAHDAVVMMFPFYWYSSPAILSEWQDAVLTYGFAYGSEGTRLHGKPLQLVVSTGGNLQDYTPEGRNRFLVEDLLRPFHATANLTGMDYLPPHVVRGAQEMSDERLAQEAAGVVQLLQKL